MHKAISCLGLFSSIVHVYIKPTCNDIFIILVIAYVNKYILHVLALCENIVGILFIFPGFLDLGSGHWSLSK